MTDQWHPTMSIAEPPRPQCSTVQPVISMRSTPESLMPSSLPQLRTVNSDNLTSCDGVSNVPPSSMLSTLLGEPSNTRFESSMCATSLSCTAPRNTGRFVGSAALTTIGCFSEPQT